MAKTIEGYEIQGPTLSQRNDAALTDGELQRLAAAFELTARYFHNYAETFRDELMHRSSRGTRPPRFMPGTRQAW